jgi:hypothetical protein
LTQHTKAVENLDRIQRLLGELNFTLTKNGYYKDYGTNNGSTTRIIPIFDKGLTLDVQYNLSAMEVTNSEIIPVITGKTVSFDKIPAECRDDIIRMLAELSPEAIIPKTESFILTMICTKCREEVYSYFSLKGVIKCIKCMGYKE